MGAKQSKRSVDISGKEAENVGEVAVAGAGGEGRMEPLADADALKPQINGDAHIHEQSDKEKQLDSGTPENEKDATTEKEGKEQEEVKEKESVAVANGENGEQKENGDSSPAPEDGKKPKKEKVKKKWSLRSISFSRKEKPKQEKKQKEEEPKTNGEPEKVPEETAEIIPEAPKTETAEEPKPDTESKEEKTPETPVTEPITNGSSTPESKVETPAAEEPAVTIPETNRPEAKAEPEPEQLPINGLSLEDTKNDSTEVAQSEKTKPEEPIAETTESAPAPEIPVIKEVCVEQMPLIEPTPPPLPANPPPSSVASFAATTMAPELTDASLANTTESAIIPPSFVALETKPDLPNENKPEENESSLVTNVETEVNPQPPSLKEVGDYKHEEVVNAKNETQSSITENAEGEINLPSRSNEVSEENIVEEVKAEPGAQFIDSSPIIAKVDTEIDPQTPLNEVIDEKIVVSDENVVVSDEKIAVSDDNIVNDDNIVKVVKAEPEQHINNLVEASPDKIESNELLIQKTIENTESEAINILAAKAEDVTEEISEPCISPPAESEIPENPDVLDSVEDLPPPPPVDDDLVAQTDLVENLETAEKVSDKVETISNHVSEIISDTNGIDKESINGIDDNEEHVKGDHLDSLGNVVEPTECNGNAEEAKPGKRAADPQEPLPVSDKIADLIPEVPVVPELNTETETTSDVAVAN